MVLQQLLFRLTWERRIKNLMPFISTGIEFLNRFKRQHLLGIKYPNLQCCISAYQLEYFN